MIGRTVTSIAALTLALGMADGADAQLVGCDEIEFDASVTARYERVQEACQDVIDHEGTLYAKLTARIVKPGTEAVVLQYRHRDGSWGPRTRVEPSPEFRALIDGKRTPIGELARGQEVNVYLTNKLWSVAIAGIGESDIPIAELLAPVQIAEVVEEEGEGEEKPQDVAGDKTEEETGEEAEE